MVVNDNADSLMPREVLKFIASRLAPTEKQIAPMVLRDTPRYKLDALFTFQSV